MGGYIDGKKTNEYPWSQSEEVWIEKPGWKKYPPAKLPVMPYPFDDEILEEKEKQKIAEKLAKKVAAIQELLEKEKEKAAKEKAKKKPRKPRKKKVAPPPVHDENLYEREV
jgi:hypothetical protein